MGYACDDARVCMASLSLCHYQARGHLSPAPGPHLLQLQGQTKHALVNMERREGRSQAAMFGKDFTEHRVMIMRTFRSRCLGIFANVWTDVHVNFEASGRLTARTLSEITSSMISSVG